MSVATALDFATIRAEGCEVEHAFVDGPLDPALLARSITIAVGRSERDTYWQNTSITIAKLIRWLCRFDRGPKDGSCLLQGELADNGRRLSKAMKTMHVLIFDDDTGRTLVETANQLPPDTCAVIWTTHSHLKTETIIAESAIMRWLKRDISPPTTEEAVAYLIETKDARPEIFADAQIGPREHIQTGVAYRLRHKPWPRVRVLIPLARPYVFLERGATQDAAIRKWKKLYLAAAVQLRIACDSSCTDPGRLMFLPRIPEGAATFKESGDESDHGIRVLSGKPFDLDAIEFPLPVEKPAKLEKLEASPAHTTAGQGFKTSNLQRFLAIGGPSFRCADWLREIAPEDLRHEYDEARIGEIDSKCPNEDAHTQPTTDDRAFHVRNAKSDGTEFAIWCMHDGCKRLAAKANGKQDRGIWLDLLCQHHGIADAAELIAWCSEEAQKQWHAVTDKTAVFDEVVEGPSGSKPKKLLEFPGEIAIEEILEYRRNALVRGIFHPGETGVIYGPPGSAKTFLAVDLNYHIAHGRDWHGRKVKRRPCLYVALEGVQGFRMRLLAANKVHGDTGDWLARLAIHISLVQGNAGDQGVSKILEAAEELKRRTGQNVGLVTIDTLARAVPGADENAVADMMAFVENRLGEISRATGAACMVVHHPNAQGRIRGSTSLPGAFDCILKIEREKNSSTRTLVASKVKDGKEGPLFDFDLNVVPLVDGNSEPENASCTVCVLVPKKVQPQNNARRIGKAERTLVAAFDAVVASGKVSYAPMPNTGAAGIRADMPNVQAEFLMKYIAGENDPKKTPDRRRKAWKYALSILPDNFTIEIVGANEYLWRLTDPFGASGATEKRGEWPENLIPRS